MHSMLRNTRGISTFSLLILLLVSGTIGAVLSYLWTVGYYVEIGLKVPEDTITITITNVTFPIENSNYFNVTVLNPSYSEADASITSIAIITPTNDVKIVNSVEPSTPHPLRKGEDITFKCNVNWGEYAGQNMKVAVFIEDGSGATISYQTKLVKLEVAGLAYNTTKTINQFNITVRNPSKMPLDIFEILLANKKIPQANISENDQPIILPYQILENESIVFACRWPLWDAESDSGYLETTKTIVVKTLQGYFARHAETFSMVLLTLSNITYPQLNTTQFILQNDPQSPHRVDLSYVTVNVGNETFTVASTNATGYILEEGFNVTILCEDDRFNWDNWRGEKITIKVYTTQGFLARKEETISSG